MKRLYGRDSAFDIWGKRVASYEPCGAIILGPTGIGKTTFADAAAAHFTCKRGGHVVTIDLGLYADERSLTASVLDQLLQSRPPSMGAVREAITTVGKGVLPAVREVAVAFARDLLKKHLGDLEHTAEAFQDLLGTDAIDGEGELAAKVQAAQLDNLRTAVVRCMELLQTTGVRIIFLFDQCEHIDPAARRSLEVVIERMPKPWGYIACVNTETSDGLAVLRDVLRPTCIGQCVEIDLSPLSRADIAQWVQDEKDTSLTTADIVTLETETGGRPYFIRACLNGADRNSVAEQSRKVSGFHAQDVVSKLSPDARDAARLLSVLGEGKGVHVTVLSRGLQKLGVKDISAALTELQSTKLISTRDDIVMYEHALTSRAVGELVTFGDDRFKDAWIAVVRDMHPDELAIADRMAALEFVVHAGSLGNLAEAPLLIGRRLINAGRTQLADQVLTEGLAMRTLETDAAEMSLAKIEVRLDQGRYNDAIEELAAFRKLTSKKTRAQADEADLQELMVLLRLNRYGPLLRLARRMSGTAAVASNTSIRAQLVVNTAWRDLNDQNNIRSTANELARTLEGEETPALRSSIARSLARSNAKLQLDNEAHAYAAMAMSEAVRENRVTSVANAHLANGEVHRMQRNFSQSIDDYSTARRISRETGRKDTEIWALLGMADSFRLAGDIESFRSAMAALRRLLSQPGFEHPLEQCHADLVQCLAEWSDSDVDIARLATVRENYRVLEVHWPDVMLEANAPLTIASSPLPF